MPDDVMKFLTEASQTGELAKDIAALLTSQPRMTDPPEVWVPWLDRQAEILDEIAFAAPPERATKARSFASKVRRLSHVITYKKFDITWITDDE